MDFGGAYTRTEEVKLIDCLRKVNGNLAMEKRCRGSKKTGALLPTQLQFNNEKASTWNI